MMIKLLYIASPSYSGSTLLTFLLNQHPQLATIGELKWGTIDLETYRCSCGELLRECPFWLEIQARVERQGLPFDMRLPPTDFRFPDHPMADRLARARNRGMVFEAVRHAAIAVTPICRERWPTIAAVNRAVIQSVLDLRQASIFVDGSKDPVRLLHLIATGDYDVHLLQLIRDGRGVCNSTIKNKGLSAETAAKDWLHTHAQIERVMSRLGTSRALSIRYEDLCANLSGEMSRVWRFLNLEPSGSPADFRGAVHHVLGNGMRLRETSEIRLDEKWRTELQPDDLEAFERTAGPLNRRYGYR